MMYLIVFLVFSAILPSNYGLTVNEIYAIDEKSQKECNKTAPVALEVTRVIADGTWLEDESVKDFVLCMMQSFVLVEKDGSLNTDAIKSVVSTIIGDNQFDRLVEFCASNPSKDARITVWKFAKCAHDNVHNDIVYRFAQTFWSVPIQN